MQPSILIAGLGLIGGSIGMRLRSRGWRVAYIDPHVTLEDAQSRGAADEQGDLADAELIVLATPVDVAVSMLGQVRAEATVTSVCSVMQPLREAAPGANFVAGHPMAGSQDRGLAAARADLFEGKPWFLDAKSETVERIVAECGAIAENIDAAEHDRGVALVSHLPQILSTALAAYLSEHEDALRFAGSGLATFLRLAGSDASVWQPVIDANRDNLREPANEVSRIVREIVEGDPADAFERAQRVWRKL